jgi:hypothetical protein
MKRVIVACVLISNTASAGWFTGPRVSKAERCYQLLLPKLTAVRARLSEVLRKYDDAEVDYSLLEATDFNPETELAPNPLIALIEGDKKFEYNIPGFRPSYFRNGQWIFSTRPNFKTGSLSPSYMLSVLVPARAVQADWNADAQTLNRLHALTLAVQVDLFPGLKPKGPPYVDWEAVAALLEAELKQIRKETGNPELALHITDHFEGYGSPVRGSLLCFKLVTVEGSNTNGEYIAASVRIYDRLVRSIPDHSQFIFKKTLPSKL